MAETKTPRQWAEAKAHVRDWRYAAADALHGWGDPAFRGGVPADHEHHTGEPMQLTEEAYDGAIAAVCAKGETRPHPPAESPYSPHRKGDSR